MVRDHLKAHGAGALLGESTAREHDREHDDEPTHGHEAHGTSKGALG
jgi:hypothetical protein